MRLAILSLLLCSCCGVEYAPPCIGKSGMQYMGPDFQTWNCDSFRTADQKVVDGFAKSTKLKDDRLRKMDFRGWRPYIQPGDSWVDELNRKVYGLTYCRLGIVYISSRPFGRSSISHEYAHIGQNCDPLPPINPDDPGHSNWRRDGIDLTFWDINGE